MLGLLVLVLDLCVIRDGGYGRSHGLPGARDAGRTGSARPARASKPGGKRARARQARN